jgi:uncharacterized protein
VAVCFLWHFPASHLGLLLAITLLCEVRTFLDSGAGPLELTQARHEPRPPSQLVRVEQRYPLRNAVASGNRIGGLRSHPPHRPLREAMFNLSGYQRQIQ